MFLLYVSMILYLLFYVIAPIAGIYIAGTKRFKDDLLRGNGKNEASINKKVKLIQISISLMPILFLIKVFKRLFIDSDVENLHDFLYNLF
jgi:hypothetical protein